MHNGAFHDSIKSSPSKSSSTKRKSGKLRGAIRKLFGRKPIKSQISLPTPTRHLENDPDAFITSAIANRYQRSASLPVQNISRHNALSSHSPFDPPPLLDRETNALEVEQPQRPLRPEQVSSADLTTLDSLRQDLLDRPNTLDQHEPDTPTSGQEIIGFAVTSGSNPKRRSRSADALYDTAKAHRMSPIQWRQWRRKSDDIVQLRGNFPTSMPIVASKDLSQKEDRETAEPAITEEVRKSEEPESAENRETFDFGLVAEAIRSQENVSLEDRFVTLEVKLMDLEYAITKLQDRLPSAERRVRCSRSASRRGSSRGSSVYSGNPQNEEQLHSSSQLSSSREQPIAKSFSNKNFSVHQHRQFISPFSHATSKFEEGTRPTSTATTLRPNNNAHHPPITPAHIPNRSSMRSSLSSLHTDHYATLITLIRREQAARHQLEDRVQALHQQLHNPRPPPRLSPRQSRTRGFAEHRSGTKAYQPRLHRHSSSSLGQENQTPSQGFDDDSDTEGDDDDDDDEWETPTERREFGDVGFERSSPPMEEEGLAF
ncbi:hypothetical protein MMC20_007518 [Loxospora ochrophaea]|nr:hypothetical protein [Loxospora ochrophaea]